MKDKNFEQLLVYKYILPKKSSQGVELIVKQIVDFHKLKGNRKHPTKWVEKTCRQYLYRIMHSLTYIADDDLIIGNTINFRISCIPEEFKIDNYGNQKKSETLNKWFERNILEVLIKLGYYTKSNSEKTYKNISMIAFNPRYVFPVSKCLDFLETLKIFKLKKIESPHIDEGMVLSYLNETEIRWKNDFITKQSMQKQIFHAFYEMAKYPENCVSRNNLYRNYDNPFLILPADIRLGILKPNNPNKVLVEIDQRAAHLRFKAWLVNDERVLNFFTQPDIKPHHDIGKLIPSMSIHEDKVKRVNMALLVYGGGLNGLAKIFFKKKKGFLDKTQLDFIQVIYNDYEKEFPLMVKLPERLEKFCDYRERFNPNFEIEEFTGNYSIRGLCKAIKTNQPTIENLNECLLDTTLYPRLLNKTPDIELFIPIPTSTIVNLKKSFNRKKPLKKDEYNLRLLNRYLIEHCFYYESPKLHEKLQKYAKWHKKSFGEWKSTIRFKKWAEDKPMSSKQFYAIGSRIISFFFQKLEGLENVRVEKYLKRRGGNPEKILDIHDGQIFEIEKNLCSRLKEIEGKINVEVKIKEEKV